MAEQVYNLTTTTQGAITITTPEGQKDTFSQYDKVIIKAKVLNITNTNKAVKFYISNPDNTSLPESEDYEYDHVFHMIPSVEEANVYSLNLTNELGEHLVSGEYNKCYFKFGIITDNEIEYYSANSSTNYIKLYKTNTDTSYEPTDLKTLFIAYTNLERKIQELEAK